MENTTRTLGRTGVDVSALGFGCWAIGGEWQSADGQPLGWGKVWAVSVGIRLNAWKMMPIFSARIRVSRASPIVARSTPSGSKLPAEGRKRGL